MRKLTAIAGLLAAAGLVTVTGRANDEELIVAKVGPTSILGSDLSRGLEAAPRIQLRYLGADARSAQRAFLEEKLIRALLWSQLAQARGLDEKVEVRARVDEKLAAVAAAGVLQANPPAPVSDDEVRAYYDLHIDRYQTPATLTLWHVLVASEEEARAILEDMAGHRDPKSGRLDVERWAKLARERSLDERTRARGGNLGVVRPDGTSSSAGVVVDRGIIDAAQSVDDLQLVPKPVPVGDRFSVVWRRKGVGGVKRPLNVVAATIRRDLETKRTAEALNAWVQEQVKRGRVEQYRPELLDF